MFDGTLADRSGGPLLARGPDDGEGQHGPGDPLPMTRGMVRHRPDVAAVSGGATEQQPTGCTPCNVSEPTGVSASAVTFVGPRLSGFEIVAPFGIRCRALQQWFEPPRAQERRFTSSRSAAATARRSIGATGPCLRFGRPRNHLADHRVRTARAEVGIPTTVPPPRPLAQPGVCHWFNRRAGDAAQTRRRRVTGGSGPPGEDGSPWHPRCTRTSGSPERSPTS
jgi:hypothetical protein